MSNNSSYLLRAFVETPWAILPSKLAALEEVVLRHVSGEKLDAEEVQNRIHGAVRPPEQRVNKVAVLPLFGTIFPRANMMTDVSGATSAERFGTLFARLIGDPEVGAIVLDVDSPGGQSGGMAELSKQIFDARGTKPIVAVANHTMASAAYWIASAADEIVVTPSGQVGSIGVFSVHEDKSEALQQGGIKLSIISEGKYKVEGNPYQPLTEEARSALQTRVRDVYDSFVNAVARNRGVEPAAVRNGFGEGRLAGAYQAVEWGMADRVATLRETIEGLFNTNASPARTRASASEQTDAVQAPASERTTNAEARARLLAVGDFTIEGESTMIRNLLKQRAEKIARAQQLVHTADAEERDMNDEERAEFAALLGEGESAGEVGALNAKIQRISDEREKLRAEIEKKFSTSDAVKPDGAHDPKPMTRAEFDKLDPDDKSAYVKHGGKITD